MKINNLLNNYKKILAYTYKIIDVFFSKSKIYVCSKTAYNNYIQRLKLYENCIRKDYICSFRSEE